MFKNLVTLFLISFSLLSWAQEATVVGNWKTIDDNTGEAKSIVQIYENNGKVFGKIIEIINPADRDKICIYCEGNDHDAPLVGLKIIKNLEKDDDEYHGGTVVDPENGKIYKAKIWLGEDNPNILNVRGYISFLYRTQQWVRAK